MKCQKNRKRITVRRYLPMTYPGSLRYKDEKLTKKACDKIRKANRDKGWPTTTFIDISLSQCRAMAVLFNQAMDISVGKTEKGRDRIRRIVKAQ